MVRIIFIACILINSVFAQEAKTPENIPDTFFEEKFSQFSKKESFDESIDKLLKEFNNDTSGNSLAIQMQIPNGRSPQNQFSSFDHPRTINSFSDPTNAPPTYIGHVKNSNEIEAISWNKKTGEYNFFVAKKEGGQYKISKPDQSTCIVCHQNKGPIFSHFPWAETDFNPKIANELAKHQKKSMSKTQAPVLVGNGFGFDNSVRSANTSIQKSKVCKELCKSNIDCKRYLLYQMLNNIGGISFSGSSGFNNSRRARINNPDKPKLSSGPELRRSEFFEKFSSYIPQDSFAFTQSTLPDRDPFSAPEKGGTIKLLIDNDQSIPLSDRVLNTNDNLSGTRIEDTASGTINNATLVNVTGFDSGSIGNPGTPRAKRNGLTTEDQLWFGILNAGNVCIQDFDEIRRAVQNSPIDGSKVEKMIFDDKIFDQVLASSFPINGKNIIELLPKKNLSADATLQCGIDSRGLPLKHSLMINDTISAFKANAPKEAPIFTSIKLSASDRNQAIRDFKTYCASCHGNGTHMTFSSKSKGFSFDFSNINHLKDYGTENKSVPFKGSMSFSDALKNKKMPPNQDEVGFTDEQRTRMLKLLEENQ